MIAEYRVLFYFPFWYKHDVCCVMFERCSAMSSVYAPQPFSYLAGGSQAPKTGFRKDEGLYGNRTDMAKPIPALRHDLPRGTADWSIDQRLRGGILTPTPADRRRSAHDSGDAESVLSYSNVRLPRADVSLYQSQIDGPAFGERSPTPVVADTPSGHYSNRDDGVAGRVDDELPIRTHSENGVFDNFILKGPGVRTSGTEVGARRTEDERPSQSRSHLEQLFDDRPSSSAVAPTGRLDLDVSESRLPHSNDHVELPGPQSTRTNSFIVTTRSVPNYDARQALGLFHIAASTRREYSPASTRASVK